MDDTKLLNMSTLNSHADEHSLSSTDVVWIVWYVVIGVFGIIGNTLVMIVFGLLRKQKSQVNLFIFDQALIDACTSVLLILFGVVNAFRSRIMEYEHSSLAADNATTSATSGHFVHISASSAEFLCRFWWSRFFLFSCFDISTWNLTVMSLERFFAVFHPTTYSSYFSKRRVVTMMIIIWLLAPTIQYVPALFQHTRGFGHGGCLFQNSWNNVAGAVTGMLFFMLSFIILVSIMGYVYFKILRKLRQKKHALRAKKPFGNPPSVPGTPTKLHIRENCNKSHHSRNITMTLCILFGVYVVCWTPNNFTFLQFNFGGPLDFKGVWYQITVVMAFINSCINPFIYAFRLEKFKKGMRMLLACKSAREGHDTKVKDAESTSLNVLEENVNRN